MDLDNIQQNLNTRVVFKEPRGMVRWLQLLFAVIAFSTVVDFYTTVGIDITCPTGSTTPSPNPAPSPSPSPSPGPSPSPAPAPAPSPSPAPAQAPTVVHPKLQVTYPFDFGNQVVTNGCPGANYTYQHHSPLEASPQFFVTTGILSLIYAAGTLVLYLLFSNTYSSIPALPVADLIITGLLCLMWLLAASTFSSGATLLKSTANYNNLKQALCPGAFESLPGAMCVPSPVDVPSWKSINVGLLSGFMSSFLWGSGMWFVFKETDIRFVNVNW